ncbi:MAG: transposase [Candidatus Paceibacterota bacterium]
MRKQPIVTGEYYHIYNRGVDKRDIFSDKSDMYRLIESIQEFNRVDVITSLANLRKSEIESKALSEPLVAIVAYCLNPNHFHFILKQVVDGGIAKFMQKLQAGYTYYFNVKSSRSGSLFQGTFKSSLIDDENYFNKVLGYVNKNYAVHTIPKDKKELVFASDFEYENNKFKIIAKEEGERVLEIFGGSDGFKNHCDEIVNIIREERGRPVLSEEDNLPDRA